MSAEVDWLVKYAFGLGHGAQLMVDGECGFGRPCVGILVDGSYPDYDADDADQCPPEGVRDAYHKHDCLAVLKRGDDADAAIHQLYLWCKALDAKGFNRVKRKAREFDQRLGALAIVLGQDRGWSISKALAEADKKARNA